MRKLRSRLTYANVMATLAFFIAIGGASAFAATQLGKNTVGSKQLKKNAVTTAKVKNGSLKAADIGGSVKSALSASTAGDSASLGGSPASAYKDSCPTGTKRVGGNLCASRPAALKGTWLEADLVCAELGLRLPSPGEAFNVGMSLGGQNFWTDNYFADEGVEESIIATPEKGEITPTTIVSQAGVVCVTTPTNS